MTLFFLCLLTSIGWAMAQNRTVKGTVISSEDNEPLIGANVVVVGNATIGAATDLDGNFTLSVPANAKTLRVSYSGMTTKEVAIANVMRIVLDPDSKLLEQVVVLGYGTGQKLSTVSGSVAKVSSEKLAEKPVANIMDALQGQVAGMQVITGSGDPTAVASVKIHGSGSLTSSAAPLYIVDGVPTDLGVVAGMNPNDFESFTILKDASSTSIYGARAANGVIVITTKRGKMGERNRVTFNASYGVSSIITKKPFENMMSGDEFARWQYSIGYAAASQYSTFEDWKNHIIADASQALADYSPYLADQIQKGILNPINFNQDTDWVGYHFRTAPTTQGDVSFQGGSQGTSYFASLGYFDQEGISRSESLLRRYTGRLNLESRINDWLKIGTNLSAALAKRRASGFSSNAYITEGSFAAMVAAPYLNPYTSSGDFADAYYMDFSDKVMLGIPYRDSYRPYNREAYQATMSGYAQFTPVKGLTLKAQAGFDFMQERTSAKKLPNDPLASDPLGTSRERFYHYLTKTFTNTAEYKFSVEDKHDVTLLAGHEFIDYEYDMFGAFGQGYENPKFMMLSQAKAGNYLTLPEQAKAEYAYLSFFGRASYGLDKWLYVDLSLRNDKSSRFGANKRNAMFYSGGLMVDVFNKFIQESTWLNDLRFKMSYGTTGNSEMLNYTSGAPEYYAHLPLVGSNPYTDSALGLSVATPGNPNLSWEQQSQFNVGVSAGFFNGRLTAEVDFYVRATDDMLIEVPLPYLSGFTAQLQNVGALKNTGFDITVGGDIVRTKDFKVYGSATFNYNREEITRLFSGLDRYVRDGYSYAWIVGKPTVFYVAEYAGVYKGQGGENYVDAEGKPFKGGDQMWYVPGEYNADGSRKVTNVYSASLEHALEDKALNPPVTGGFSLGASWKDLSLDADFAYIIGKWMINNDRYFTENTSSGFNFTNKDKSILNAWTEDNPTSDVPRIGQQMQFDSRLLENASFLRLKNLKLTYNLPQSLFAGQKVLSGARVYMMARNLLTVTKFKGFDPEAGANLSMNQYPNTKQYMFGVQLSF